MTRAGIAIASLASLAAATVITGFAISRAEATDGAQPNTSCATTAACVEGDNTSTGPGVKGTSTKGHGVVGTTKSKGTTSGTDHAGVLGQDLQTGGGPGNAGLEGTSTNGTGVVGTSTNGPGVAASGTEGVNAVGTVDGVLGTGTLEGVEGENTVGGSGDAVLANGFGGDLFRGNNSSGNDVFIVDDGGNTDVAGSVAAAFEVSGLFAAFGDAATATTGVHGFSSGEAVEGENNTTGDAIYANGFGGPLFRGNNSLGSNVFEVDDAGEVFAVSYNFFAEATKIQPTSLGQTVKTYSAQAAQPTLEDNGEAQLVNGVARVALDPAFGATIDRSNYAVQITPEGMTHGVLCVTQRTPGGFVVQENMGGRSTVPFSYRIVGKPYGSTAPRLPLAVMPAHFGQRVAKVHGQARIFKAPHHAKPQLPKLALHG